MKAQYRHVAFSIPKLGCETELERWYDENHIPDCLRLTGFVAAQRFRIEDELAVADVPAWRIMVIYEIEGDEIAATLSQIPRVVRTPEMSMTDAIDMTTTLRCTAVAAGPRQMA